MLDHRRDPGRFRYVPCVPPTLCEQHHKHLSMPEFTSLMAAVGLLVTLRFVIRRVKGLKEEITQIRIQHRHEDHGV
jgi:hypothetical protein